MAPAGGVGPLRWPPSEYHLTLRQADQATRRLIPLTELAASERWVLYTSADEMNEHYANVDAHKIRQHEARAREEQQ